MKVVERVLDVTSTLEGEKIGMTINTDALAHIMSVLTDLYSDPEMAVIREYSTNAFDAHIEAGVTRPIEVTLPAPLAPFFTVRDFGFGLDIDDIRDIYSQYGASTKRDSDDVVGMLGLGCKSALTYTDQFTLSSVKDGILTTVAVSRDADGAGSMTVVEEIPTDEPSGTTVVVPVKTGNQFDSKSHNFFRFWTPGTVLVNGTAPKRIGDDQGLWLDENTLLTPEADQSYIVMGNVAYPWDTDGRKWQEWPIVAYVEIGAVQFVPSREQLQMTKLTEATLFAIKQHVSKTKESAYQKLIDDCPTRAEALATALVASRVGIKGDNLTYKGQTIPLQMTCEKDKRFIFADAVKRWRRKGWDWNRVIPATSWPKAIWLTGYDGADFSAHKRKKIEQWAADKGLTGHDHYILLDRIPKEVRSWIDKSLVYSWEEPKAVKIKVERQVNQSGRVSGSYEAHLPGGDFKSQLLATEIDTSKPIFFQAGRYTPDYDRKILDSKYNGEYTLVRLGRNRINKFKRDFPSARDIETVVVEIAQNWADSLTPHDKLSLHLNSSGDRNSLKKLDETRIDDPEIREAIRAAKRDVTKLQEKNNLYFRYVRFAPVDWKNPLDKYALLTSVNIYGTLNGAFADHLYLYLNAAHAAKEVTN